MRQKKFTLVLMVAALASAAARDAGAQQIRSPFRYVEERQVLNPFAGIVSTGRGELDLGPESGKMYGLRYDYHVSGPINFEAEVGYFTGTRTVFGVAEIQPDSAAAPELTALGTTDLDVLEAVAALRFNLTGQRTYHGFLPFLAFGGGAAFGLSSTAPVEADLPADEVFDFGTSFAGLLGAGIEWYGGRRVAVRADVRDLFWKLETPDAFLGPRIASSEWVQNVVLSAGVSIRF